MTDRELDPGAYIGRKPELPSQTIPGGVRPDDDRVAYHASRRAAAGEPGTDEPGTDEPNDPPATREAGRDR